MRLHSFKPRILISRHQRRFQWNFVNLLYIQKQYKFQCSYGNAILQHICKITMNSEMKSDVSCRTRTLSTSLLVPLIIEYGKTNKNKHYRSQNLHLSCMQSHSVGR